MKIVFSEKKSSRGVFEDFNLDPPPKNGTEMYRLPITTSDNPDNKDMAIFCTRKNILPEKEGMIRSKFISPISINVKCLYKELEGKGIDIPTSLYGPCRHFLYFLKLKQKLNIFDIITQTSEYHLRESFEICVLNHSHCFVGKNREETKGVRVSLISDLAHLKVIPIKKNHLFRLQKAQF